MQLQAELKGLNATRIPRRFRAKLANYTRRVGLVDLSVRILNRIIRSERPVHPEPSPEEICEYGSSLIRLGAREEGLALLRSKTARQHPRSTLYEAFGLISQWDYAGAIPLLQTFINQCSERDSYQLLVARVNLVAAYAYIGAASEAIRLGEQALQQADAEKSTTLKVSLLIYLAELSLQLGKEDNSQHYLKEAKELPTRELDHLFCEMLHAVHQLENRTPSIEAALVKLDEVDQWARKVSHWNTIRRCDKYRGIYTRDSELVTRNYYGSPFSHYREDLIKMSQGFYTLPEQSLVSLDGKPLAKDAVGINFATGEGIGISAKLKPDQLLHRAFKSLCSDVYAPIPVADLHYKLYPGEFFNPDSSYNRVYNAIYLLREWIESNRVPLEIQQVGGKYRLSSPVDFAVLRKRNDENFGEAEQHGKVHLFAEAFGEKSFSAPEAAEKLDLHIRKVQRMLSEACKSGEIESEGGSRNRRYSIHSGKKAA